MSKILFIITGGTIDSLAKDYNGDSIFEPNQKSLIPDYIISKNLDDKLEFIEFSMKDSKDITNDDLQNIVRIINKSDCDRAIITYGTDAMVEAGAYLEENIERGNISIILTGAMIPLRGEGTDGYSNLDFAMEKVVNLEAGVYIGMHKQIFNAGNVKKDFERKKFVEIFDKEGNPHP